MIKANFHTHTNLCHHAEGSVDDYCQAAVKAGISVLGFSDHCPFPDGRWASVRMSMEELPGYVRDIQQARIDYPQLTILTGLECEHVPELEDFQRECFLGEFAMDYLIGGTHSFWYQGKYQGVYENSMDADRLLAYADCLAAAMDSGLYSALAHPDLFAMGVWEWGEPAEECSRRILEKAAACQMPLEINAYGLRKAKKDYAEGQRHMYPVEQFWRLAADYDIEVLPGSDAHRPEDVWGNTDECMEIAKRFGLKVVNNEFLQKIKRKNRADSKK